MEFTTLMLAHKKSEVQIESEKKYDIYTESSIIARNFNKFKIFKGSKFFDVIGLVNPWNIAISEKFKTLLEDNNITGWKCYPIEIENTNLQYFLFEITGRAGLLYDVDEDGDIEYGSIRVDISSWDGCDIFKLGKGGIKVITLRTKAIMEQAKISNIEFWNLNRY